MEARRDRRRGEHQLYAGPADRPVVPARTTAPSPTDPPSPATTRVAAPAATASPAPRRVVPPASPSPRAWAAPAAGSPAGETPLPPASSGFAPALDPRAIVATPRKPAPKPDAVTDSSAIAPAIDMQVVAPELQGAESLAGPPRQKSDSAMKRILRAVSGKKDLP